MRIEILVGSVETTIIHLKQAKMSLGSGEFCDIIVPSEGVSRKHLLILTEGDHYFVVDQGSTNGSYINEERLVPGKKVELTSFFPVRLGENVLLSLLPDDEYFEEINLEDDPALASEKAPPVKFQTDQTSVISLSALNKVKTENLVLERNKKRKTRKKATNTNKKTTPKAKTRPDLFPYVILLLVGAAGYYNFVFMKSVDVASEIHRVGEVVVPVAPVAPQVSTDLVPKKDLPSRESMSKLLYDLKCATGAEKYLCQLIPGANTGRFGVTQVGLTFNVMVDGTKYLREAEAYVKKGDIETLKKTAALLFLIRDLPALDEKLLSDSRVAVAFFTGGEEGPEVGHVLAFYPEAFNREKPFLNNNQLRQIKSLGSRALVNFDRIFQVY